MAVVPDDEKYGAICEKVKKRLRFERLAELAGILFVVFLVVPILMFNILSLNQQLGDKAGVVSVLIGILLASGATALFRFKLKPYYVDDDEWTIYYARPLYISLVRCLKEKSKEMKEDYRKAALKYAEKLLSCVQQWWKVGTFKPIRQYEKGTVSTFQKNLRYRIIPAIKEGNYELLQKVAVSMHDFLYVALTLNIEAIRNFNEKLSSPEGLPDRTPVKIGYTQKSLGFLHARKQHLAASVSIGAVCLVVLYGLLIWGLSKESAVSDTLILLGILISAYVAIRWSTSKQ